jgi:hypothetical protein
MYRIGMVADFSHFVFVVVKGATTRKSDRMRKNIDRFIFIQNVVSSSTEKVPGKDRKRGDTF